MSKITFRKHFDTIDALLNEALLPTPWKGGEESRHSRKDSDLEWYGNATFGNAVNMARTGWSDGLKSLQKNIESLAVNQSLAKSPAFYYDIAGAYPVPALAAAGIPENMVSFAPVSERARPIVRLVVALSVSCFFNARDFQNYGAGLVSIIDALESNDCRVELTIATSGQREKETSLFSVTVKEAQDSLDLDRIAFCLSHIAFYRRIFFGIYERILPEAWSDGYGRPRNITKADIDSGVVIIPSAQTIGGDNLKTPESAFKALLPAVSALLADHDAAIPEIIFKN